MIDKYVSDGGKYEEEGYEDVGRMEREYEEEERGRKEKEKEEVNREEKEAVMKEIEKLFMERDKERERERERDVHQMEGGVNEDNVGNKEECIEDKKIVVENKEEDKDKGNDGNEHEECKKDSGVEDMLIIQNDKNGEDDNKVIQNNVPEFLEGFVDSSKVNVQQSNNLDVVENNNKNNNLQISHEAVKERKQKIEIIQKEYKETNSTNTNNNNNENTDQLPKQSTNEYEELEEFQI
jgi:hypothetical protein